MLWPPNYVCVSVCVSRSSYILWCCACQNYVWCSAIRDLRRLSTTILLTRPLRNDAPSGVAACWRCCLSDLLMLCFTALYCLVLPIRIMTLSTWFLCCIINNEACWRIVDPFNVLHHSHSDCISELSGNAYTLFKERIESEHWMVFGRSAGGWVRYYGHLV